MLTIPCAGVGLLFDSRRSAITDRLRQGGASTTLLLRFANSLSERRADIMRRFIDAIKQDPKYEELLVNLVVGSPEWNRETLKLAETVPVEVVYQTVGALGKISVAVGTSGFPIFMVEG